MEAVIVDTNVIVIANGEAEHASWECVEHCQNQLKQMIDQQIRTVVDDKWRVFNEYRRNVNVTKQKGIGDVFVKRLLQNWNNPNICTMVKITSLTGNGTDFEEFPNNDEALKDFHKNDRKFIAVALAYKEESGQTATILLAIDRGWKEFVKPFAEHGVHVEVICDE